MSTILLVIILILLFGGGGGYYAHSRYGGTGLGGVLGIVLIVLVVLWLVGREGNRGRRVAPRPNVLAALGSDGAGKRGRSWVDCETLIAGSAPSLRGVDLEFR